MDYKDPNYPTTHLDNFVGFFVNFSGKNIMKSQMPELDCMQAANLLQKDLGAAQFKSGSPFPSN